MRSHPLQRTCLTWCAKFGISTDSRRILGHHADPHTKSVVCYSRDAIGPEVFKLLGVLRAIGQGTFHPDVTRSGRFVKSDPPAKSAQKPSSTSGVAEEGEEEDEAESSSSSVSSSSESSDAASEVDKDPIPDSTSLLMLAPAELRPGLIEVDGGCEVWLRGNTGRQHLAKRGATRVFCGRSINSLFVKATHCSASSKARCIVCFQNKASRSVTRG